MSLVQSGARFKFALVQAFQIGEGVYLHLPVVGIQGKLWDDSPLPDRRYPGPSDLHKKIDWIPDLRSDIILLLLLFPLPKIKNLNQSPSYSNLKPPNSN